MASLQKKSLIATAAIFCCRFTGLLRELAYTALFGATGALDAFLTAFRVPNMLRDMFAEGALSQSFTSVMSKVEKLEGSGAAWQMANRLVSQMVSLMLCIVAGGVLLSGFLMQQLYPERALLVPNVRGEGAVAAAQVEARYQGLRLNADGIQEACFDLEAPLAGMTPNSCLRVEMLESLPVGSRVCLYTGPSPEERGGEKLLRVEPQSFIGLAVNLCRIMWPFILLASLSALCMGALNVFGIFGLPNLSSAAFNLTVIIVGCAIGWWIDPHFGSDSLYGFAAAVVLGGIAQILVQLPRLRQKGYHPRWDLGINWRLGRLAITDPHVRRIWYLMLPGVIAAGITQTNIFINTSFALYLPSGAVTALSCAFHLWQLPVALFGVATGMVVLPSVSRMALEGSAACDSAIPEHLARAMRFMLFFAVPSAVFLGFWGEEIVCLFFQRGRFDAAASAMTGQVLAAYSLGLLGYAGMKVLQPVFLALEKPWAPAGLALLACTISLSLNYTFVRILHKPVVWLALTTSVVTTLNFLFYFLYLRRILGHMAFNILLPGITRIAVAGVVLGGICWGIHTFLFQGFTSWEFGTRLAALLVGSCVAGSGYLLVAWLCRAPELQMLVSGLLGRKKHAG